MSLYPPGARMPSVEKLVWQPAPFQSPSLGLGEMLQITPWLSVTRSMMYRAMERWSPISMPRHGPTWYSHWPGITSALSPDSLIPAYRQAFMWLSATGRPYEQSNPAEQ